MDRDIESDIKLGIWCVNIYIDMHMITHLYIYEDESTRGARGFKFVS